MFSDHHCFSQSNRPSPHSPPLSLSHVLFCRRLSDHHCLSHQEYRSCLSPHSPSRCLSWVAHMKEDLPAIFHKTWQTENPAFLLSSTRRTSACHCRSPSGLPTNCGIPFSTLPESLTSLTVHLRAHVCSPAYPPQTWEQKDFDGNLIGTKEILMGT